MVKDHSDREIEETCCRHIGYSFIDHPTGRVIHTTAFVTPVVEHWVELEIAQWRGKEEKNREIKYIMSIL